MTIRRFLIPGLMAAIALLMSGDQALAQSFNLDLGQEGGDLNGAYRSVDCTHYRSIAGTVDPGDDDVIRADYYCLIIPKNSNGDPANPTKPSPRELSFVLNSLHHDANIRTGL